MRGAVLATAAVLWSISGLGGGDEEKIEVPSTKEIWSATVTDDTLTDIELTDFSWDGFTHVQGSLGAGTVSIRFDDISKLDIEPSETKNKSWALVSLKSGGL